MHASIYYSLAFAAFTIVVWALGVWLFLRVTGRARKQGENDHASREALAMAWSESATRDIMDRFPRSAGPVVIYAEHALNRKDYEEAVKRYRIAIERDPDHSGGYLGVARALRAWGRPDEAEPVLRTAVRRFPREKPVLEDYARTAQMRRDWPEAVRRWELVRKHFPDAQPGYRDGAEALRAAGRVADAEALLAAAEQRFPTPAATAKS